MSDESSSSSEDERIDLSPFERQLASLEPRSCNLDRDRLMFLAGQAAAARGATQVAKQTQAMWFWQVVSGVSTVAATVLAVLLAISSADRTTSVADGSKPQVIAPTPKTSGTEPDRGSPVRNGGNAQTPILPAASPAAVLAMRRTLLSGDAMRLAVASDSGSPNARASLSRNKILSIRDSQFELGLAKRPRQVSSFPWYPIGGTL